MPFFTGFQGKRHGKKDSEIVFRVDLEKELHYLLTENRDLQGENDDNRRLIARLKSDRRASVREAEGIRQQLTQEQARCQALQEERKDMETLQEQLAEAQEELRGLNGRLKSVERNRSEQEQKGNQAERVLKRQSELEQEIRQLRPVVENHNGLARRHQNLQTLQKETSDQLKETRNENERLRSIEKRYTVLKQAYKTLHKERSKELQKARNEPKLSDWSNKIQNLKDRISESVEHCIFSTSQYVRCDLPKQVLNELQDLGQVPIITRRISGRITSCLFGWLEDGVSLGSKTDATAVRKVVTAVYAEAVESKECLAEYIADSDRDKLKAELTVTFRDAVTLWSKVSSGQ